MNGVIGIDPGLSGGIALLRTDGYAQPEVWVMPVAKHPSGKGKEVDYVQFGALIWSMPTERAYVEVVHAMPNQGVVSMFKFGTTYGAILQACASGALEVVRVRPQAWKKEFDLIKKDKDAALEVVAHLWPALELPGNKTQRLGVADALLIAEYGRRQPDE